MLHVVVREIFRSTIYFKRCRGDGQFDEITNKLSSIIVYISINYSDIIYIGKKKKIRNVGRYFLDDESLYWIHNSICSVLSSESLVWFQLFIR